MEKEQAQALQVVGYQGSVALNSRKGCSVSSRNQKLREAPTHVHLANREKGCRWKETGL